MAMIQIYISLDNEMMSSNLESTVAVARALGHPARARAVAMLRSGELCVCQITEVLGLAASTVSIHLKELKRSGLIVERKEGRWVYISLATGAFAQAWINPLLEGLQGDPQLVEDDRMVEELRRLPVEDLCRLGYQAALAKLEAEPETTREPAEAPACEHRSGG